MANTTKNSHGAHNHGHAAQGDHAHAHIGRPTYYRVFGALMLLMILTVAAWWVEPLLNLQNTFLGEGGARIVGIVVAMAIAIAKTTLIIMYFMHVKISERITQLYAAAAFIGLAIMVIITMGDYFARGWPPQLGPLP
jgi:cytochrome c oxidase subunit 4